MSIKCPKCHHENPDDTIYCGKCTTPLRPSVDIEVTETLETPKEELTRGTTLANRYEIIEELGKGGMGTVYRVEDTRTKEDIALKLIKPEIASDKKTIERFRNELTTARKIRHKNVCGMYDLGEYERAYFITMEYVPGEDLKSLIRRVRIDIGATIKIAQQVCDGLEEAHRLGVVHRDLKPSNIMIDKEGNARIMDFGIARTTEAKAITDRGIIIGTPEYLSPEQAETKEIDHRSDIYSLGVILYEMVTGQVPFEGDTPLSIVRKHVDEKPKNPKEINPQIPDELNHLILKCLEKDKEKRYQNARGVRSELANIEYGIPTTERVVPKRKPITLKEITVTFGLKKLFIPALVVVALVIAVVIILQLLPKKKAIPLAPSDKPSLAIMYFENLKDREDKERIGEMVSELLITDLSESQYMRVVSSQRLYDISKIMRKEGIKVIDKTVASEVAKKAQAKYMLLGKILSTKPELVITSQMVDVETGNVVASQRIAGPNSLNIFSLVDSLSYEIKKDIELPALAQKEEEKPVADITTHSPEALRLYLEGNELLFKAYIKEAAEKFERAVRIDPTFASAYLKLAMCYMNRPLTDMVMARGYMEKAAKFSYKVSKKEKILIDAIHLVSQGKWQEGKQILEEMARLYPDEKIAHLFLAEVNHSIRNYEEAIAGFNKVIELDPFSKEAYSKLAYVYDRVGRYEEAIKSINKYIELAAGEANPYDTRGDIYARHAEIDKAIESYKRALEIKSDFAASVEKLGLMYLFKREYGKAERYFLQYGKIGGKIAESSSRADLALIPLSQGRYDLALKILEKGIAADELDKQLSQQVEKYITVAEIRVEKKEFDKALQNGQKMLKLMAEIFPEALPFYKCDYGYFLAEAGQIDSAVKVSNEVKEKIKDKTEFQKSSWYFLEYKIKYHSGDIDQALKEIAELAEREKNSFRIRFFLAKTYLESGKIGEAVQEFERLANWNILQTVRNPLFSSKIPYFLGICYEKSGWEKKAMEKYEEFLEIWKDADPGLAEVEDARKRLAGLKE